MPVGEPSDFGPVDPRLWDRWVAWGRWLLRRPIPHAEPAPSSYLAEWSYISTANVPEVELHLQPISDDPGILYIYTPEPEADEP